MAALLFSDVMKTNDPQPAPFQIAKTQEDEKLVFGWANVAIRADGEQITDYQKDIIDPVDLEKAAYLFALSYRSCGEMHWQKMESRGVGTLVESCVFTKEKQRAMGLPDGALPEAWWIGFKIHDDAIWEKIKDGTYKMFSIEGVGVREEVVGGGDRTCPKS